MKLLRRQKRSPSIPLVSYINSIPAYGVHKEPASYDLCIRVNPNNIKKEVKVKIKKGEIIKNEPNLAHGLPTAPLNSHF